MGDEASDPTGGAVPAADPVPASAPAPSGGRSVGSPTLILSLALALLLVVGVGAALLLGRDATTPSTDTEGAESAAPAGGACGTPWPAAYQGAPNGMKTATEAGFYVWWDGFGFHLRGIDPAAAAVFKGQIVADTELPRTAAKVAPADSGVTIEAAGNVMTFSFKAAATPSGLDVAICKPSQLAISVSNGANLMSVGRIRTGVNRFAVTNPMVLTRQ